MVVTRSSVCGLIWQERRNRYRGVVESVKISNDKVKNLVAIGGVVDKLAKLSREEENIVRFVTVKITHKEEPGFRMFYLQVMEVGGNVVREDRFFA